MARDINIIATSCDVSAKDFGQAFKINNISLQHATTLVEVKTLSEDRPQGCIITDCKLSDVWFDTAFHWFDDAARDRPLIIILRDAEQVLEYRAKAKYARDIYPLCSVGDNRFMHVFPAALLYYNSVKAKDTVNSLCLSATL